MTTMTPSIEPFGEGAYLITLGHEVDEGVNARVHSLAARLDAAAQDIDGMASCVPAYASLLVPFDPRLVDAAMLADRIRELVEDPVPSDEAVLGRDIEIPVRYGGEDGPDLADVADRVGLSADAVVDLHAGTSYRVFMLGFAPGFAYLGPLPPPLRLPRRAEPRLRVPAGSVAIAAAQTAVYPHVTAGGWNLLGRTDIQLWDPDAPEPAALRPGDRVLFVPS